MKCTKCSGEMKEGWVTEVFNKFKKPSWVDHINWLKENNQFPVKSYRCQKCGYLESYAQQL